MAKATNNEPEHEGTAAAAVKTEGRPVEKVPAHSDENLPIAVETAPGSTLHPNGDSMATSLVTVAPEQAAGKALKTPTAELAEKIKELVRLAQEQGYLTYGDINDALPEAVVSPEDLDELYSKLRNLEVEIVDQAEV